MKLFIAEWHGQGYTGVNKGSVYGCLGDLCLILAKSKKDARKVIETKTRNPYFWRIIFLSCVPKSFGVTSDIIHKGIVSSDSLK